jgi:hypothetical protein
MDSDTFHIALLVPDGVGVRNCILGPFAPLAAAAGPLSVYHVIPPDRLATYSAPFDRNVSWRPLEDYRETPVSFTLRWSLAYAQMYWADTRSMRYVRRMKRGKSLRSRTVHGISRLLGRLCANRTGLRLLDAAHCQFISAVPEVEKYRCEFQRSRPSVLFCTHQRPPSILPPVLAARSLGIPTATFIFSWDNLTSKGRIAAPFDHFLVWSEHMRAELLRYYPDVAPERVHVVGTPQFDPYADASLLWSRAEFCRHVGADPARPLICYSGGDTITCPEDPEHLRVLMRLIRSGQVRHEPQIVLRPAPVDDPVRYAAVQREFPELILAAPAWIRTGADWSRIIPLPEDVQFLANLTLRCDLNVNMASTMTLDFASHDKPVVNLAFDIADPPVLGQPVWDLYYHFDHYRPVVELSAARFARSPDDLAAHINAYLEDPALDREGRRNLVEMQIGLPLGQSSREIIATLRQIAGLPTTHPAAVS